MSNFNSAPSSNTMSRTPEEWNVSLTDRLECNGDCMFAFFCSQAFFSKLAYDIDDSMFGVFACPHALRSFFRGKHNIKGSLIEDLLLSYFCCPCSLLQLKAEAEARM